MPDRTREMRGLPERVSVVAQTVIARTTCDEAIKSIRARGAGFVQIHSGAPLDAPDG